MEPHTPSSVKKKTWLISLTSVLKLHLPLRCPGKHPEEADGQTISCTCGGQAAESGPGVGEKTAAQEERARCSAEEYRTRSGRVFFYLLYKYAEASNSVNK